MGEESSVISLVPLPVTGVIRIESPDDAPRFVDDHDGDVEIRTEDSGRFTLQRHVDTRRDGVKLYQLIGNYGPDWFIERTDQVRFEP